MFSAMTGTIVTAVVIACVVFAAAALAEGRGQYFLRVILGIAPKRDHVLSVYNDIPRDTHDWSVVGSLGGLDREYAARVASRTATEGAVAVDPTPGRSTNPLTLNPARLTRQESAA